jgi:hypothetical protein
MNAMNGMPIVTLAAALGLSVDLVARQNAGHIIKVGGIDCVSVERSEAYVAEHRRHCEAERHRQAEEWAAKKAQPFPLRERVRRLAQRPSPADPDVPALAMMMANDPDNALERSSRAKSEMIRGDATYHRVRQED